MSRDEKAIWDGMSGIYDGFMKKDMPLYREISNRIGNIMEAACSVIEIATGTGIIALELADRINNIEAVDFSTRMIQKARNKAMRRGIINVNFSVQDACSLLYEDECFDAVIIANALHIMPEPEKVLAEIKRLLKPHGRLIAPTFVHAGSKKATVLSRLMSFTRFRAYHKWTEKSYHEFLKENGFTIVDSALLKASFPLAYVVGKQA